MRTRAGLALLACMLLAAPAHAASDRAEAERALEKAERVLDGRGVRTGREATGALRRLAVRLRDLSSDDRGRARSLLARPTDGNADQFGDGYSRRAELAPPHCTTHFCVHYVNDTSDAPDPADGPDDGTTPDYVDAVGVALETSYARQNGDLSWVEPLSDAPRGGDARTDAYLVELGTSLFGYAAPDPGQGTADSQYSYLVLDNDYDGFDDFATPLDAMRVTAAHEYNHVLQFTYDVFQADWMYESTATWMEDEVFDSINDYVNYVDPTWRTTTEIPLTESHDRIYGSAVWNLWLSERYGPDAVREAWDASLDHEPLFAPGAYGDGIAAEGGTGFSPEFGEFAAGTAEWQAQPPPGRAFSEGSSYGDVERLGALAPDGPGQVHQLDHTTFKLLDVPVPSSSDPLQLSGSLPGGTSGAVALVGREGPRTGGGPVSIDVGQISSGGSASATLAEPNRFQRITAVLVNASVAHDGPHPSDPFDLLWRDDDEPMGVALVTGSAPPEVPTPSAPPASTGDTGTSAPPPDGGAPGATSTQSDVVRPALAGLRLRRKAFRAFRGRGASIAARRGTRVRYSLSEEATVTFRVRRRLKGGRVRRVRGRFRHAGGAGANSFRFTGRVRRRALKPGHYVLRARAKDGAGNVSRVMRVRFRIVRR